MPHRPPKSGVQRLDRIGGVNNLADLGRKGEERRELVPGVFPGSDHCRILLSPVVTEVGEQVRGGHGLRRVDAAHGFEPLVDLVPIEHARGYK